MIDPIAKVSKQVNRKFHLGTQFNNYHSCGTSLFFAPTSKNFADIHPQHF